jgi:hypothetical protein
MKNLLRLEEALEFFLAIFLFQSLPQPGWLYAVLFLAPDVSMLGYIVNTRVGAVCYNIAHHKGLAIALYVSGVYFQMPWVAFSGLLLFGHSAFDRLLGYGLKYPDHFKHTHLGWLPEPKKKQ